MLGNELSIANMKTWLIYEVICDEFELQGIDTGALSSSQEWSKIKWNYSVGTDRYTYVELELCEIRNWA